MCNINTTSAEEEKQSNKMTKKEHILWKGYVLCREQSFYVAYTVKSNFGHGFLRIKTSGNVARFKAIPFLKQVNWMPVLQ